MLRATHLFAIVLGLAAAAQACQGATSSDAAQQGAADTVEAGTAMPPIAGSTDPRIVSTLAAAGMSVDNLPDLTTLKNEPDHTRLHAVMKSFTIALGTDCSGCHIANATTGADFAVDTPRKNVARRMWSTFLGGLERKDGSAIYCDTCHQGKVTFLDRSDHHVLAGWMKTNFVQSLARRDGAQHDCSTCHGDPFKGNFLDDWEQGPADAGQD